MWRDPFCLQQSNSALHIAGCHYVVDSLILSVCTSLCFIHRQPTYERGAGANGERTHARTRARNPFKDENEPWRGEERERERERGTPSVCVFPRAHILFHLTRTLIWLAHDYGNDGLITLLLFPSRSERDSNTNMHSV